MKRTAFLLAFMLLGGAALAGGPTQSEAEALEALRIINNAQRSYLHAFPEEGYACDLAWFAVPHDGIPSPNHAGLLEESIIKGEKNGYSYILFCADQAKPQKTYRAAAVPSGKGLHAYCTDETGVVKSALDGKPGTCFKSGKKESE